jgi:hypothetical protein
VTTVLRYVAEQFDARVEPIVGGWCWGYAYKTNANNPSQLSCHASGTAIDINAPDHPNGSGGTFTNAQRGQIYAILDELAGAVRWLEGYDEMHFEVCVDPATLARVAASLPTPTEPEDDMPPASVLQDVESGWLYAIAPGYFAAISTRDGNNVDQYANGVELGLWRPEITVKNWVEIMSMRDVLTLAHPSGIYTGTDANGNPTFR